MMGKDGLRTAAMQFQRGDTGSTSTKGILFKSQARPKSPILEEDGQNGWHSMITVETVRF